MARHPQGFTLLELMIAMAIVSILTAIAYPAYQDNVLRSNRGEALAVLQSVAIAMEEYKLAVPSGDYSGATLAGLPASTSLGSLTSSEHPSLDRYTLSLLPATPTTSFAVQATPTGAQAGDGPLRVYWDGRQGWDSDNDGTYEPLTF